MFFDSSSICLHIVYYLSLVDWRWLDIFLLFFSSISMTAIMIPLRKILTIMPVVLIFHPIKQQSKVESPQSTLLSFLSLMLWSNPLQNHDALLTLTHTQTNTLGAMIEERLVTYNGIRSTPSQNASRRCTVLGLIWEKGKLTGAL